MANETRAELTLKNKQLEEQIVVAAGDIEGLGLLSVALMVELAKEIRPYSATGEKEAEERFTKIMNAATQAAGLRDKVVDWINWIYDQALGKADERVHPEGVSGVNGNSTGGD